MDDADIEIDMSEPDYEGSVRELTLQVKSRVKIPQEWLDSLDMEESEKVLVIHDGDHVKVARWNRENVKKFL